jgi:small-conductance mechanosensitive channel
VIGIVTGTIALAALVIGSEYGGVHSAAIHPKIVAWVSALVILLAGVVATERLSVAFGQVVTRRSALAAGSAIRVISAGVGYLFVIFAVLAVLDVSIEHLLVGVGLAGVVLGIAAQQSLGNVFAGLVLVAARPFNVGEHVRIRSGPLGGIFDASVQEMSLTYVTVQTEDGLVKIPNSAMLAAGVGRLPQASPAPAGATAENSPREAELPDGP